MTGVFLLFTEVPCSLNSFRYTGSASHQMYLTAPLQNVTHSEHPRRLLFIQTPDPHQYDNMTTASCHSSERNKIFSSLFLSLGKWKVTNYSLYSYAGSSLLFNTIISSWFQFCSSFCAWCLATTAKQGKARSRVGWLVGVVGGI